jgi:hypothetical protein
MLMDRHDFCVYYFHTDNLLIHYILIKFLLPFCKNKMVIKYKTNTVIASHFINSISFKRLYNTKS